eukprot:gene6616-4736_t
MLFFRISYTLVCVPSPFLLVGFSFICSFRRNDEVEIVTMKHRYTAKKEESISSIVGHNSFYLCDSCLRFFHHSTHLCAHSSNCPNSFWIPGQEIYRCNRRRVCIYEIDGRKHASMCYLRRLSILTKLFLPEKVTLDDVHFFAFTALFEVDDFGFHFAGYFSKEWQNSRGCFNTLSCIMVLPPYKGKQYGSFLAELSYELGRRELSVGTPERPLSWSGKHLFRKIWSEEVMRAVHKLEKRKTPLTINSICKSSGLIVEDALVGIHDSKALFIVGRQGPLFVLSDNEMQQSKKRRLCQDSLQWESMLMQKSGEKDCIVLQNVLCPYGVDFTVLSLARLFDSKGINAHEIFVEIRNHEAKVVLRDPCDVQKALINVHGTTLFGGVVRVLSGEDSIDSQHSPFVTFQPSSTLMVTDVEHGLLLELMLSLYHIKGVVSVAPLLPQRCLVCTASPYSATCVRSWLLESKFTRSKRFDIFNLSEKNDSTSPLLSDVSLFPHPIRFEHSCELCSCIMDPDELLYEIAVTQERNIQIIHESTKTIERISQTFFSCLLTSGAFLLPFLSLSPAGDNTLSDTISLSSQIQSRNLQTAAAALSLLPQRIQSCNHPNAVKELEDILRTFGYLLLRDTSQRKNWKKIIASIYNYREITKNETAAEELLRLIERGLPLFNNSYRTYCLQKKSDQLLPSESAICLNRKQMPYRLDKYE